MTKGVGETIDGMSRRQQQYQNVPWGLLVGAGALVVIAAVAFLIRSRITASADPMVGGAPAGSAALDSLLGGAAPSGDTPSSVPREQILGKALLPDAIAAARPQMQNTIGRLDGGSALLALWASRHLTWAGLEALPETSPALFRKDPEAERGNRLCMSGTVREIRAEKTLAARLADDRALPLIIRPTTTTATPPPPPASGSESTGAASGASDTLSDADAVIPDDGKVFIGVIEAKSEGGSEQRIGKGSSANDQPLVVEIIAVRSSGSLVDGSEARVCGILTGVNLAAPSHISPTEVTEHRLVGMFDLPQNRSATNEVATHGD
jgi:hypothetical protein